MAKQLSMKQQIYQQIANKQVQEVLNQQREKEKAKLMADFDAWQKQQQDPEKLIADFNSWKASQNPQPAPIKQSTVNEVKTEAAPKQQIPSLEDFFTPTTASGKNINKESAKYIQRKEKERELAAKNSKEAIAQKIVENKEVKPFVPETNIEDQNSVNDYRKALLGGTDTERTKKNETISNKKQEIKETEVQKQMSAIPESAIEQYAQSKDISIDDARAEVEEAMRKANAMNTTIAPTNESKIDKETTEKAQALAAEQKRKSNQKQFTPYESFLEANGKALADIVNGPVYLAGKATGTGWDLIGDQKREEYAQSKEQHPVASNLGTMTGMAEGAWALGGGAAGRKLAAKGLPDVADIFAEKGLGAAIKQIAKNAGKDIIKTDLATDILPTLANDIAEGKSAPEVAGNTVLNTLMNYGFNSIGDIVSLGKALKDVNASPIPNIADADNIIKNASEQADEAAQNIDDIARQIQKTDTSDNLNYNKVVDGKAPKEYIDPADKALSDPNIVKTHTPEQIEDMKAYVNSTDSKLLEYIDDARNKYRWPSVRQKRRGA